ncbi:hypothetical protein [uncultured Mailhella sp.]|uniref:hypothetical protein n=1 Tax=uncultured Mailhella sp. TaxID=1981031 RepID=UPI00262F834A|nr:hypothetical protein [uncultured Mailhella sp.]
MADDIDQSQQKNDSDGNTLHGNLQDSMATRQGDEALLAEMKIVFNKLFLPSVEGMRGACGRISSPCRRSGAAGDFVTSEPPCGENLKSAGLPRA